MSFPTYQAIDLGRTQLIQKLVDRYAGRCSREEVEQAVADAYKRVAGARVGAFVPILVERFACELLDRTAVPSPGQKGP